MTAIEGNTELRSKGTKIEIGKKEIDKQRLVTVRLAPQKPTFASALSMSAKSGHHNQICEKLEATGSAHKFVNGRYKLRGSLPLG